MLGDLQIQAAVFETSLAEPPADIEVGVTEHALWLTTSAGYEPYSTRQALARGLVRKLNLAHLDEHKTAVHLHAAALEVRGIGLVLSGTSGSGKSTLAAAMLVRSDGGYLTDESVCLHDDDRLWGLAKPISLRPGGQRLLEQVGQKGQTPSLLTHEYVRASSLGRVLASTQPGVIVLLSGVGDPDQYPDLSVVEPAAAAASLILESPDVIRHGHRGVERIARLCHRSKCYALGRGGLAATVDLIADLTDELTADLAAANRSPDQRFESLQSDAIAVCLKGVQATPGTVAYRCGEGLVLYSETRQIVASVSLGERSEAPSSDTIQALVDHGFVEPQVRS